MLLFHGTTVSNAKSIIKNGFQYESSIWNCSENKTYFFTSDFLQKEFDVESENEILSYGIQHALEQSMITLAVQNPKDYRGAVLVFDTFLMNNQDEIEPDLSCPNMENMAVALANPDLNGLVGFYIMDEDVKSFRFFTLASMMENTYLNEVELSDCEQQLVSALRKSDVLSDAFEITSQMKYTKQKINQPTYLKVA